MNNPLRPQVGYAPSLRGLYGGRAPYPVGLGPAGLAPSLPDALGSERGTYVRLPGANFPPPGSTPVDETGDGNIAPGASAVLITFQVPTTLRTRFIGIGFGADDETALRFLTWSIQFNGVPINGYSSVPAAIGSLRQLATIVVNAGADAVVTVVATALVTAVLTYRYIARLQGYNYNELEG